MQGLVLGWNSLLNGSLMSSYQNFFQPSRYCEGKVAWLTYGSFRSVAYSFLFSRQKKKNYFSSLPAKKKMMHKCLPYESRIPEDVTSCANENPSSAYGAPSSGNGAPSSSYGAPQGSSYSAPVKTLSDMIAPAGIQKSRKVHREFIALHNPFQVQFHNLHQSKITPPPLRIQFRSEMQCNPIKTLMDHL